MHRTYLKGRKPNELWLIPERIDERGEGMGNFILYLKRFLYYLLVIILCYAYLLHFTLKTKVCYLGFYISWLSSGLEQVACFDKMILCGFLKTLRACGVADWGGVIRRPGQSQGIV